MTMRTLKTRRTTTLRWVSRIALTVAIMACGSASEDSAFGTREGALTEDAEAASDAEVADLLAGSDAAAEEAGDAVGTCELSDSDDSDGDESDDDDGVESDDDGVESDDDDTEKSAADGTTDESESDGDDDDESSSDDESDGDEDSDSDDCVPAPEAPEVAPSQIQ